MYTLSKRTIMVAVLRFSDFVNMDVDLSKPFQSIVLGQSHGMWLSMPQMMKPRETSLVHPFFELLG